MTEAVNLSGKRILIVEDNALLAFEIESIVEQWGAIPVGPALDLATGFALSESASIDGALLDINLGDEQVWPLAQSLNARGIPIVFVSANCSDVDFPEHLSVCAKLDKPAQSTAIVDTLSCAIA